MTLIEAAALLGVTPDTLRQQIARGKLVATKRGRDWWVTKGEVERYRGARRHWFVPGPDALICADCGHPQWNAPTGPDYYHKGRPGQSQPSGRRAKMAAETAETA